MTKLLRSSLLLALIAATLSLAACGGSSGDAAGGAPGAGSAGALLHPASSPLGKILVDAQGDTVYYYGKDSSGTSACAGDCVTAWPIVAAPADLPASLPGVTGALAALKRTDGGSQLTLDGHPLYTFVKDTAPGQINGQGLMGLWNVVSPTGAAITAKVPPATAAPGGY